MSKEAMKLALEALEGTNMAEESKMISNAIKALEEALAKQEQSVSVSNPIGEFPKTILAVIKEVANRNPKNGLDRWTDYETGAYMQDDADAALLWIKNKAKQEQSAEHVGEPVAVKHMMEWVTFLKARSDNGQHKQIPSNLSAGACWDLAVELEQFINTHPQPKREPLTDEQIEEIADGYLVDYRIPAGCAWNFARDIEAAHGIKE